MTHPEDMPRPGRPIRTLAARNEETAAFFDECATVLDIKAEDYSYGDVPFLDFERIADLSGLPREMIAFVLMSKHIVALARWASTAEMTCDSPRERLRDVANYCAIMASMDIDNQDLPPCTSKSPTSTTGHLSTSSSFQPSTRRPNGSPSSPTSPTTSHPGAAATSPPCSTETSTTPRSAMS